MEDYLLDRVAELVLFHLLLLPREVTVLPIIVGNVGPLLPAHYLLYIVQLWFTLRIARAKMCSLSVLAWSAFPYEIQTDLSCHFIVCSAGILLA